MRLCPATGKEAAAEALGALVWVSFGDVEQRDTMRGQVSCGATPPSPAEPAASAGSRARFVVGGVSRRRASSRRRCCPR